MRLTEKLTYANVAATVALVLSVAGAGGAAYAVGNNTIGSPQLKAGAVRTSDLGKAAVTSPKLKDGAVGKADLANAAVDGTKLADGSVTGPKIADGSVAGPKIADGSVAGPKIADGAVTGAKVADGSLTTDDLQAGTPGIVQAAMNIGGGGAVLSWFNRLGGQPTVANSGTGTYDVTIPGVAAATPASVTALAVSRNYLVDCRQWDIGSGRIQVRCYNQHSEAFANAPFDLVVFDS